MKKSNTYEINASDKTDLTIKDKNLERNVVLFEFKRVNSPEMVSKMDLARKAMFELILYYVLEEYQKSNTSIIHLIISDGYQFFIFEKGVFWELFGRDKKFVDEIISSEYSNSEKRNYIYNQIIKPKVERVKDKLSFTFVDLNSFSKEVTHSDIVSKPRFKALYKLFSPIHLQKLPFSEDHNSLNRKFYTELLYIMGGKAYVPALAVIPPVMVGYVFQFVYSIFKGGNEIPVKRHYDLIFFFNPVFRLRITRNRYNAPVFNFFFRKIKIYSGI